MNDIITNIADVFKFIYSKYSDDVEVVEKMKIFISKYNITENIVETKDPSADDFEEPIIIDIEEVSTKRSKDELLMEVENVLVASKVDRDIELQPDEVLKDDTVVNCIRSIKKVDKIIKTLGRKTILYYGQLGEILGKLKVIDKKNYLKHLKINGVPYTSDYINFIIRLSNLLRKHNTLIQFSVSIHFFMKHFKLIKELCEKNNW